MPTTPQPIKSGKVRDIYRSGENLVLVASDRISAFDVVLPTPIPQKGKVLTLLSAHWFGCTGHIVPNHLLADRLHDFPADLAAFGSTQDWDGRAVLVKSAHVLPVECVVRGYLSGSGWKSYQESGQVCGVPLPEGLQESDKLPTPIFTPTTKVDNGHDEPITYEETVDLLGPGLAEEARDTALALYEFAAATCASKGIIMADTKFELGLLGDELILVDEMGTPDSSRFWDASIWNPGQPQDSFDKQYVRDYLETLTWSKTYPGPELPEDVVRGTAARYQEAFSRVTGQNWPPRPFV